MVMIRRAELVEHLDDSITPEVRRVGHRRTPIAVRSDQGLFVQQLRMLQNRLANRVYIVAPDDFLNRGGISASNLTQ
jgi:hypothetical protein